MQSYKEVCCLLVDEVHTHLITEVLESTDGHVYGLTGQREEFQLSHNLQQ